MPELGNNNGYSLNFWRWFFHGSGSLPGYKRVFNSWLIQHLCIGSVCVIFISTSLESAARAILFPLTGVLISVCASWAGPTQTVLTSEEMIPVFELHEGGACEYFNILQAAILIMFATISIWGLAGIGVFESLNTKPLGSKKILYYIISIFLYGIISLSLKTCWEVILYAHNILYMKTVKMKIDRQRKLKVANEKEECLIILRTWVRTKSRTLKRSRIRDAFTKSDREHQLRSDLHN